MKTHCKRPKSSALAFAVPAEEIRRFLGSLAPCEVSL